MIELDCEVCGTILKIADDKAGGKGKCPECGAIFRIPEPAGASGEAQPAPAAVTADRPEGRVAAEGKGEAPDKPVPLTTKREQRLHSRARAKRSLMPGIIAGSVVGVLLLGFIIHSMWSGKSGSVDRHTEALAKAAEARRPGRKGSDEPALGEGRDPLAGLPDAQRPAAREAFADGMEFFLYDLEPSAVVLEGTQGAFPCTLKFLRSVFHRASLEELRVSCSLVVGTDGKAGELPSHPKVEGTEKGTVTFEMQPSLWSAAGNAPAKLHLIYRDPRTGRTVHCSNTVEITARSGN